MLLTYVQLFLIVILCLISSFSDYNKKKIYNKNLIVFLVLSSITYLVLFKYVQLNNLYFI